MTDRKTDMQALFDKLSEKDRDIMLLIARSVQYAQKVTEQSLRQPARQV